MDNLLLFLKYDPSWVPIDWPRHSTILFHLDSLELKHLPALRIVYLIVSSLKAQISIQPKSRGNYYGDLWSSFAV